MAANKLLFTCAVLALAGCGDDGSATLIDAAPTIRADAAPPILVAPTLTSFTASPNQLSAGFPSDVTWTWTYGNLPFPEPMCTINNGVGVVTKGAMTSVNVTAVTTFTLTCTNSAGTVMRPLVVSVPPVAPNIATFVTNPTVTQIGMATNVAWSWTYTAPPVPAPTCSISPTVGPVTNGQTTSVNQNVGQTYTLTCVNASGSRTRTVFLNAATTPVIATFTANPMTLTTGVAANVTFAWTFSNTPSPTPTCSIDNAIGTLTNGSSRSVTLAATTIYTLTCTNTGGAGTSTVTLTAQ